MISRRELWIRMHLLLTTKEVLEDVEQAICKAADAGKFMVEYKFPERADKLIKDEVYMALAQADLTLEPNNDKYGKVIIS